MQRRTTEAPMDFEWEHQSVPKADSPFKQAFQNLRRDGSQNFRAPTGPPLGRQSSFPAQSSSIFSAPIAHKPRLASSVPPSSTAPPHSGSSIFSAPRPSSQPAQSLFSSSFFSTPQNMAAQTGPRAPGLDDSDSESHSEHNDANEPLVTPTSKLIHGLRINDPSKTTTLSSTTEKLLGRGGVRASILSNQTKKRISKRKPKSHLDSWALSSPKSHSNDYSDEDEGDSTEGPSNPRHRASSGLAYSVAATLDPVLLTKWYQAFFGAVLLSLCLYLVVMLVQTIQADIKANYNREVQRATREIADCGTQFLLNKCQERLPAMIEMCNNWERCMAEDPAEVGAARVSAITFATIINSFFETISYKSLAGFTLITSVLMYVSALAFGTKKKNDQVPYPTNVPYARGKHPYQWGQFGPAPPPTGNTYVYFPNSPKTLTRQFSMTRDDHEETDSRIAIADK